MQLAAALSLQSFALKLPDEWRVPPSELSIKSTEAHVWRINLESLPPAFESIISHDERERASRFHFQRDRNRFIAGRGSLRTVLARYLGGDARALEFEHNAFGKPFLADGYGSRGLQFNLSHSNEIALLAVTLGREVGIDIEFMRADFATDEVARGFFSRAELAQLATIEPEHRAAGFFNCWTRKEAYIKARGEGLSLPLDGFDVSVLPNEPPAVIGNRLDPLEVSRWSLHDLSAAPGYAATIAVEGSLVSLKLWDCAAII